MRPRGMAVVGDRLFVNGVLHVLSGVDYAKELVVQRGNCRRYAMERIHRNRYRKSRTPVKD